MQLCRCPAQFASLGGFLPVAVRMEGPSSPTKKGPMSFVQWRQAGVITGERHACTAESGDTRAPAPAHSTSIDRICGLNWRSLDRAGLSAVAWAYHYFSIQFRENLQVAYRRYPSDMLKRLVEEECHTDNLSPWPGVVAPGEKVDHDEFMRRALALSPVDPAMRRRVTAAGKKYLARIRAEPDSTKSASIASYEDGGLARVFAAILQCPCWDTPLLAAFRHFLERHICFDNDPTEGHGALARHLPSDERVAEVWNEFYTLLIVAEPRLAQ